MKILFATGHPHLPQFSGGSQSSTHELALELMRHGHQVSVLAALWSTGYIGLRNRILMKLLSREIIRDDGVGYPVYRKWFVWENLGGLLQELKPDVALVQAMKPVPVAQELMDNHVPTIVYLRDVEFKDLGGDPRTLGGIKFIANSQFTAERFLTAFGIASTVVPPLFHAQHYRTSCTRENVTFINPSPNKGLDIALALAESCPEIPFVFVESWPLDADKKRDLLGALARLPNARFQPRTRDMRAVYRAARIVLMPSRWEEAWGRVASEAHFSGIPILASTRGGLPESVGPGGVLIDPDAPREAWTQALRRLWTDQAYYQQMSHAALAYSARDAIRPERQIEALLSVAEQAVHARTATKAAACV